MCYLYLYLPSCLNNNNNNWKFETSAFHRPFHVNLMIIIIIIIIIMMMMMMMMMIIIIITIIRALIERDKNDIDLAAVGLVDLARLAAISSPHLADWMMALQAAVCGLALDTPILTIFARQPSYNLKIFLQVLQLFCVILQFFYSVVSIWR